jgi:hypothetical protein
MPHHRLYTVDLDFVLRPHTEFGELCRLTLVGTYSRLLEPILAGRRTSLRSPARDGGSQVLLAAGSGAAQGFAMPWLLSFSVGAEHLVVREVFPELVTELVRLLEEEGERELAICAWDLRLVAECGCGDSFCQSFRSKTTPRACPMGPATGASPSSLRRGCSTSTLSTGGSCMSR